MAITAGKSTRFSASQRIIRTIVVSTLMAASLGSTVVDAAGTRVISGRVLRADGVVPTLPVPVVACPVTEIASLDCAGRAFAFTQNNGIFSLQVDDVTDWNVFAGIPGSFSTPIPVLAGPDVELLGDLTAPIRLITGTVSGVNPSFSQVHICTEPYTDSGCPNRGADPDLGPLGEFALHASSVAGINVFVQSWLNSVAPTQANPVPLDFIRTAPSFLPAGTSAMDVGDVSVTWGTVSGTVTYNGGAAFSPGAAGVGACPVLQALPANTGPGCIGLRYAFADSNGSFKLNLSPGEYSLAGFVLVPITEPPYFVPVIGPPLGSPLAVGAGQTTSANFVADPDGVAPAVENAIGDANGNGILDSLENNVASLPGANGDYISVVTAGGAILSSVVNQPVVVSDNLGAFPTGSTSFSVAPVSIGATVVVEIILQQAPSAGAVYYKLVNGIPEPYDSNRWSIAGNVLSLTLTDGGVGDEDRLANGVIVDPGAIGAPLQFAGGASIATTRLSVKAGAAVPVRWRTVAAGLPVADPSSFESMTSSCRGAPDGDPRYLGDGLWELAWKTVKKTSGTCSFTVALAGGTTSTTAAVTVRT